MLSQLLICKPIIWTLIISSVEHPERATALHPPYFRTVVKAWKHNVLNDQWTEAILEVSMLYIREYQFHQHFMNLLLFALALSVKSSMHLLIPFLDFTNKNATQLRGIFSITGYEEAHFWFLSIVLCSEGWSCWSWCQSLWCSTATDGCNCTVTCMIIVIFQMKCICNAITTDVGWA